MQRDVQGFQKRGRVVLDRIVYVPFRPLGFELIRYVKKNPVDDNSLETGIDKETCSFQTQLDSCLAGAEKARW